MTVPLAATAPGVYSLDQSGSGAGAILHADFSLVNAANPAAAGETVLIYMTGMGTVTPNVADGTAGTITTLYKSNADVGVLVAGKAATVSFSGLAPGWNAKSAQLKTFDITCSDKFQPYITTSYERFGNWRTQWDGNTLRVYLADASCSSFDAAMPLVNKQNHTGSYYQLVVVAYGPRCTDPLTGKPDQQCVQRVQQGLQ